MKGPTRRPMQQSTHWNPPQHHQQHHFPPMGGPPGRYVNHPPRPFGRGGGQGPPRGGGGGGSVRMNGGVRGGMGGGRGRGGVHRFTNNNIQRTPLREPKENFGRGHRGQNSKSYPSNKPTKTPPKPQNSRQPAKPTTNHKEDLQKYFVQHNLGEVPYKVAAVGTKGKEKYMATVTVEGKQFKTYPQTFNTRVST